MAFPAPVSGRSHLAGRGASTASNLIDALSRVTDPSVSTGVPYAERSLRRCRWSERYQSHNRRMLLATSAMRSWLRSNTGTGASKAKSNCGSDS
jgi:hypothetical protein